MGIQIIALNTQVVDINAHILKAFFNKGSNHYAGYRKKPEILPEPEGEDRKICITPISAYRIYHNDRRLKH